MNRILVTGGSGFLGTRIVGMLLERGEEVTVIQRSAAPMLEAKGVKVILGSLLNRDSLRTAMQDCRAVIHTAAKAGVWGKREEYFATNFDGTVNLVETMDEVGISTLVHCSTPSVVFSGESFHGADESLPYGKNWLCPYAESKAKTEEYVLNRARSASLKAVALRPHLIFGRGDPHLLPRVIERAKSGRLKMVGDGTNVVDITAIDNAARAHLQALDFLSSGGLGGKAYFLSQGEPVNLWNWINEILIKVDVSPIERRVSLKTAYRLGGVLEFIYGTLKFSQEPPMTRFVAVELAKSHWFSIESARKDFGYHPENHPTEVVLNDFLESLKQTDADKK